MGESSDDSFILEWASDTAVPAEPAQQRPLLPASAVQREAPQARAEGSKRRALTPPRTDRGAAPGEDQPPASSAASSDGAALPSLWPSTSVHLPAPVAALRSRGLDSVDFIDELFRFHGLFEGVGDLVYEWREASAAGRRWFEVEFFFTLRNRMRQLERSIPPRDPQRAEHLHWMFALHIGLSLVDGVVPVRLPELAP